MKFNMKNLISMNEYKDENLFKKEALAVAVKFASSNDLKDPNSIFS